MIRFVCRQLRFDVVRSVLTTTALAAVVAVILVLEGFYAGLLQQLRSAVLDRQADLIATQAGVANMIATRSILPQFSRANVEAIEGVAAAHPLTGISIIYEQEDERTPVFLFIQDTLGGPGRLRPGRLHALFVDRPGLKIARMNVSRVSRGSTVLDFHYMVGTNRGVREFRERHTMRNFTGADYAAALRGAGLKVVHDRNGLTGRGLYIGVRPGGVEPRAARSRR